MIPVQKADLSTFLIKEEEILKARLEAVRAAISNSGEKGRSVEYEVMHMLRSFLPNEYGLTTGFIAYHDPKFPYAISSQIDILIYDALRSGPLARLGVCDVLPIEAVYGYVEVKSCLNHTELLSCIRKSNELRAIKKRKYWVYRDENEAELKTIDDVSVRSYVFAIEADPEKFIPSEKIENYLNKKIRCIDGDAFMTGICVSATAFLRSIYPQERQNAPEDSLVKLDKKHPLLNFKLSLLEGLSRFPRVPVDWTPAIDSYCANFEAPDGTIRPAATATTNINLPDYSSTVQRFTSGHG